MQEAGATATLEMAFTIADGIEYCRSNKIACFSTTNGNDFYYLNGLTD